jgi:hypothetical protein
VGPRSGLDTTEKSKILLLPGIEPWPSTPNIDRITKSRKLKWARHVTCMGEQKNAHKVFVGKPESKRTLGKPTHRGRILKFLLQK